MKISVLTRRDIVDSLLAENISWRGRLEEPEFLSRIYDLSSLQSTDSRFKDAAGDIWQHRVNNPDDWPDDWIFSDARFDLPSGDDETFLRFLCEVVHPVVRPDVTSAQRLVQMFNLYLQHDGFQIVERTRISGRPVYVGRYIGIGVTPGLSVAREALLSTDPTYIAQQITRMEAAISNDPALAIGTAKELVETCCKTILKERKIAHGASVDIPELVKLTTKALELTPPDIPETARATETIKRLLSNLGTITQGLSELRNHYGTGHGKAAGTRGLSSRHAKLAVGAASTLAVFLAETHNERASKT